MPTRQEQASANAAYEAQKTRARDRQAQQSRSGRDIGKIPKVVNRKRRAKAEASFRFFCDTYCQGRFPLPWSDDHLDVLIAVERTVREGGQLAIAMPRGSGKTTILEAAVLWSVLIGQHKFAVLIAATASMAPDRMAAIKAELLHNDLLLEDWPEVCYPIRQMEGIANRCAGQTCNGAPTSMMWGKRKLVLPTIPKSKCGSAVLVCGGLLEAVRGLKHSRPDGKQERPSICMIDDPQTRRSAKSVRQSEDREKTIAGDVLYLAGPGKKISALMACTVIEPQDMADRMLSRDSHPEWHGERKKLLYAWPTNTKLWDEYAELLRQDLTDGGVRATRFYRKNRRAMDAGAKPAWPQRKNEEEVSAIQHAMNLWIRDRQSFMAEMQNEPEADQSAEAVELRTAEQIAGQVSGYARNEIAQGVQRLTWFCDVGKELLYWSIVAWETGFTGHVVDYGTWPEQSVSYFDAKHARQTISRDKRVTATTLEGKLQQAMDYLLAELAERTWTTPDGAEVDLALGLIDANWGESTNVVYEVCRQAKRKHGLRVMPSHGVPFGPAKRPISQWPRKTTKGAVGDEWHVPPPNRGRGIRHVLFDAGRRKSFLQRRLSTPAGDPGGLTLFHAPPHKHKLLAEHLTAETGVKVSGPHGELTVWTLIPGRDNHWLDCLSGCCTAEAILGGQLRQAVVTPVTPSTTATITPPPTRAAARQRVKYLDL